MNKKVIIPLIIGVSIGFIVGGCNENTSEAMKEEAFKTSSATYFYNGNVVEVTDKKTNERYMVVTSDDGDVEIQKLGDSE